jgi:hypothetical protein
MRKLVFIGLILAGCSGEEKTEAYINYKPELKDTIEVDSVILRTSELIKSTENADKKVKEIKAIKSENVALKKELVETKAELEEVKAILADTISAEPVKKKKKTFIQKVISTIKRDSI